MTMLDRLESSVLFRLTRLVSLLVVAFGAIMITLAFVWYVQNAVPVATSVSSAEVRELMKAQPDSTLVDRPHGAASSFGATAVSAEVERLLAELPRTEVDLPAMRSQIMRWMDELPDVSAQLEFIRQMRSVVGSFEDSEKARACFSFAQSKLDKMEQENRRKAQLVANSKWILATVTAGLFLIAISSLVLVLLRIERNTRAGERAA